MQVETPRYRVPSSIFELRSKIWGCVWKNSKPGSLTKGCVWTKGPRAMPLVRERRARDEGREAGEARKEASVGHKTHKQSKWLQESAQRCWAGSVIGLGAVHGKDLASSSFKGVEAGDKRREWDTAESALLRKQRTGQGSTAQHQEQEVRSQI